ncbi:hypothetical protein KSP35_12280 [Aquihabitans sp. G128]|uniref:hypothetical protein n=1 Tax=Aquihabitans sp. G128 TaxID=2849779 RepID=UPI001C21F2BA|nr:hypothetical protein [Aquihabitans sp. G128]QXC59188.1 hypothetical protein KSP35_12280 [Aquihabitans sp. G128]
MEIAAQPAELITVGHRLHALSGTIKGTVGAASLSGGGTGDPEADAALGDFQRRWSRGLEVLAIQVAAYGTTGQVVAAAFQRAGG